MERENDLREEVGRSIEQMRESEKDMFAGDRTSFETMKQRAIQQLGQDVASLYQEEPGSGPQLGCFDAVGKVTNDRSQCAESQSTFFGLAPDQETKSEPGDDVGTLGQDANAFANETNRAFAMPDDAEMMNYGDHNYQPQSMQHAQSGVDHPDFSDAQPEMLGPMMDTMGKMMQKFPKLFAIFERENIEVPQQARDVAQSVVDTYDRLSVTCRGGEMAACMEIANAAGSLEASMRPSMEGAMMQAVMNGKIKSFDRLGAIGREIETLMSDGMEGMMGPSGHQGEPPADMMQQGYGAPMNRGFGEESHMMQPSDYSR